MLLLRHIVGEPDIELIGDEEMDILAVTDIDAVPLDEGDDE